MRSLRALEPAVLAIFALVLLGGIAFSVRAAYDVTDGIRYFSPGIGTWAPSQQEREVLRLRELVTRLALGGTVSEEDYALQRDLMLSRIKQTRESQRGTPELFENELALIEQIEQAATNYGAIEGGVRPSSETARQLLPLLTTMASISHDFLNARRDASALSNAQVISTIQWLQGAQIGTLILLALTGGGLFWLMRRALSTDLTRAYAEARERAAALEASQAQLTTANRAFEQQNVQLLQTLAELEATVQARRELEVTIEHLDIPIIPVLAGVLVMPLVGKLDGGRLGAASKRLLTHITQAQIKTVIVDITGVSAIDTTVGQQLLQLARAVTLLGCTPILVGIGPAAAEELVQIGFRSDTLITYSTLQQAVEVALRARPAQRTTA